LVVDGEDALAGPRCFDLRAGAADHFQLGTYIGQVGTRERWRAALPPVEARTPLAGWVVPGWGDEVVVEPVTVAERLPCSCPTAAYGSRRRRADRPQLAGIAGPADGPVPKASRVASHRRRHDPSARPGGQSVSVPAHQRTSVGAPASLAGPSVRWHHLANATALSAR
jgi:hypothetical protein